MASEIGRRSFLQGIGLVAGASFGLASGTLTPAGAAAAPTAPPDWRRLLADQYLAKGAEFVVRPLQAGLEIWEVPTGGYMVVETGQKALLEGSPTAISPYRLATGDLVYLGPGGYFAGSDRVSTNLLSKERVDTREMSAFALDAADTMAETLNAGTTSEAIAPLSSGGPLTPVQPGDVRNRVLSYSYITGSHVYANNSGICGWVAGSIVTRYWHARSSARKLLPAAYRSGTNMTASPNFATYLQGNSSDSTWARAVKDRLIWNANGQGVSHEAAWALGNLGMDGQISSGYPVIIFGHIPLGPTSSGAHAVVAYGHTNNGYYITHYGWAGYTNIILNSGLVGSNTKFRLP